jgi:hypothetical protein
MNRAEKCGELIKILEQALEVAHEFNDDVAVSLIERALRHARTILILKSPNP